MKFKENVTRAFNKTKFNITKHSPEILIIGGAIGVVSSAIMACRATTKLKTITDEHKHNVEQIHYVTEHPETLPEGKTYTKDDSRKDLTITYAHTGLKLVKLYAPSVILGTLSLTCMITSSNILRKRNAALAAAYTAVDKGFKNYRHNVVERFGEEVDKELRYNIKAKQFEEVKTDKDGKEKKVKNTVNVVTADMHDYSPYAKFYDCGCDSWQKDPEHNLWYLKQQQNYANEKLKSQGYLFLNDVYEMLGIPKTKAGQIVGWIYDDKNPEHTGNNFVDFGIYNVNIENNADFVNGYVPTIILDFNVDGNILDKI